MSWVTELIDSIPQIVGNLAPGFLMMAAFSWVISFNFTDGKNVLIISAVLSYLIRVISDALSVSHTRGMTIMICVVSALLGVIAAVTYKSEFFNNLLARIRIKRTTNKSIWDDAIGEGAWVAILDSREQCYYCGQFQYQNYENETSYIVINTYYVADLNGKILEGKNYGTDTERMLMIKLDNYDTIIISKKDPFGHYKNQ